MSAVEARLKEQGIELPKATTPAGNYVPYVINGDTVYVSGQIPIVAGEVHIPGLKCYCKQNGLMTCAYDRFNSR